jgi:nitroreductase
MDSYNFILSRRSVRKYKDKDIKKEDLNLILKAASHAPNPYDHRTWKLIVITDKELIERIAEVSGDQLWIKNSNILIIGVILPVKGTVKWKIVDISIAMENMVLMAQALGYGSCWIGYFNEKKLKDILKIPNDCDILAYLTLGVSDEIPKKRDYGITDTYIKKNKFK